MPEGRHPGINMHNLPVGGGFIGILFAVGSAVIFIVGFPTLWYFVALAFALGIAIAVVLKIASHRLSDRSKPLSILRTEKMQSDHKARRQRWHRIFQTLPSASGV